MASGFTNNPLTDSEEAVKTQKRRLKFTVHTIYQGLSVLFLICAEISVVLLGTKGSSLDSLEECEFPSYTFA